MVTALIARAEDWEDIADVGEEHRELLQQYGDFTNGIPVHDTISLVVNMVSEKQFQRCFSQWMEDCHEVTKGDVVPIDGRRLLVLITKTNVACDPYSQCF